MGLTTDLEKKWLYWLVRSYDGSELHRAPTADKISSGISEVYAFVNFLPLISKDEKSAFHLNNTICFYFQQYRV